MNSIDVSGCFSQDPLLVLVAIFLRNRIKNFPDDDYYDVSTERSLTFYASKKANRRHHFIGDNKQLQCRDPETCPKSGYLEKATCYNYRERYFEFSLPDASPPSPRPRPTHFERKITGGKSVKNSPLRWSVRTALRRCRLAFSSALDYK